MRRSALLLIIMVITANAWKLAVTVDYYNPQAAKELQVPTLRVKVVADYNPVSASLTKVRVSVTSSAVEVSKIVRMNLDSYLRMCDFVTKMPLATLVSCVLESLKDIISLTNLETGKAYLVQGVDLSGVAYLRYTTRVSATISERQFNGFERYYVKAYADKPQESFEMVLANAKAYLKVIGESSASVQKAYYVLVSWPRGKGVVVLTSPPLAPPTVSGKNPVTLSFKRAIVKYFVAVSAGTLPKTYMLYFEKPVKSLVIPFSEVTLRSIAATLPSIRATCSLSVAVLSKGYHNITLITDNYKISVKSKGFEYTSFPVECNGVALLRVDSSYALLNLTKVVNKKLVVIPTSPVLRLVTLRLSEPGAIVFNGTQVYCGSTCYLLAPFEKLEIELVGLISKTSAKALLAPSVKELVVRFPPPPPAKGCLVKFVSPRPLDLTVSTGTSVFTVRVSKVPKPVVLPCGANVELKVGSYRAKLYVRSGEWVYLCPSQYATGGEAVRINTTMKPPLGISCDGGLTWAAVNNSTFVMIKPKYSYIELKVVSASGASADVILPEGVKVVKLSATKLPPLKKASVPRSGLSSVEKIVLRGLRKAQVIISNGTQYIEYEINGRAFVALPPKWLTQRLNLQLKTPEGIVINSTVPPPTERGVTAPIYVLATNNMIVNYKSLKIFVSRGSVPAQAPIYVNGQKILINGSVIVVVPNTTVQVRVGDKTYEVYANGQTFNVTLPSLNNAELVLPVNVTLYLEGKRASGVVRFSTGNFTVSYKINGTGTVLLPSFAGNVPMWTSIVTKSVACTVKLPKLLTQINNAKIVSPIVALLSKRGTCYAYKIVAVKGQMFKKPANIKIMIGNSEVEVRGSLILIYDRPVLTLRYGNESYTVAAGGTIYLKAKVKAKRPLPVTTKTEALSVVSALKKVGKWNPVGELPGMVSLATGMILALGLLNSGITPSTPIYAISIALASISMVIGLVTLALILTRYFAH